MPDSKITALTALTAADPVNDMFPVVDVSDTSMAASGTTKRISVNNILSSSPTASGALTITGLVTAGSATITGALDAARLNVTAATIPANGVYLGSANNLSFSAASTLAMTLNSTGLGVGVVPSFSGVKLSTRETTTDVYAQFQNGGTLAAGRTSQLWLGNGPTISSAGSRDWRFTNTGISATAADWTLDYWNGTAVVERIRVDSGGNLGMNVTPRPWAGDYRAVQVAGITALWGNASISAFSNNIYWDGSIRYIAAQAGSFFQLTGKQLAFNQSTDASPAAGGVAAYSEVFKIDTNGNPIFIPSATPATLTTNGQLTVNATSNTNLRFSYRGSDGVTRVANITLA